MNFQVGDMLRYITSVSKRIMYCLVLETGKDSGIVLWLYGADKQFQQTVDWKSYYGTFERVS